MSENNKKTLNQDWGERVYDELLSDRNAPRKPIEDEVERRKDAGTATLLAFVPGVNVSRMQEIVINHGSSLDLYHFALDVPVADVDRIVSRMEQVAIEDGSERSKTLLSEVKQELEDRKKPEYFKEKVQGNDMFG